jgi:hypothetical protein
MGQCELQRRGVCWGAPQLPRGHVVSSNPVWCLSNLKDHTKELAPLISIDSHIHSKTLHALWGLVEAAPRVKYRRYGMAPALIVAISIPAI